MGAGLLYAAQAALSRGGRTPPPCGSPEGAPRAVLFLLVWAWMAAQSAAALFSQTLDAGLVPTPLLPAFGALAALQFVGVTLAPALQAESTTSRPLKPLTLQRSVQASKYPWLCVQAASLKRATVCCPGVRGSGGGGGT